MARIKITLGYQVHKLQDASLMFESVSELMPPGLSKDIQCHGWYHSYLGLQINPSRHKTPNRQSAWWIYNESSSRVCEGTCARGYMCTFIPKGKTYVRVVNTSNGIIMLHVYQYKYQYKYQYCYCLIIIQYITQICSEITHGRVLSGEIYAQRLQKLIYLHLFTDCFMKISLQSTGPIYWREIFMKQSIGKCR